MAAQPEDFLPAGGVEEVKSLRLTDKSNAFRLKAKYSKYMRHRQGRGWYVWNHKRWKPDPKGAHLLAADVGELVREEFQAREFTDSELAKWFYKWAKYSESAAGLKNCLDLAHSMPCFNGDRVQWDSDPLVLNCENRVVKLASILCEPHRPERFETRLCPTKYDREAKAPRWERFLLEVFDGDEELISYLQWALGYSITGLQTEHVFFFCHGSGANGKSTLFQALRHVLGGDYFHTLDSEAIMVHIHPRHAAPIAQLEGKRLVICNESADSRRLNEALIKSLCGGDSIRADLKNKDPIEFNPECKIWLLTNHKPSIRDDTLSMWRRILLVPFLQTFTGDRADTSLAETLAGEAQGILAWLVEGAKRAKDGEPDLPEAVRMATSEYKAEEDTRSRFLEDQCETWEHATVTAAALYAAYKVYMNGRCESQKVFGQWIADKEFERTRLHGGVRAWKGLRLKEHDDNDLRE